MLEPNILAHSRLVTTDLGVTCFMFGAVYFLWRTCRRLSVGNIVGLVGFTALALTAKFSAVLLVPIMLALLIARACRREPWPVAWRRDEACVTRSQRLMAAALVLVLSAAGAVVFIWGVYRFHYMPAPASVDPNSLMRPKTRVAELVPKLSTIVNWADQHRLLPNAYSQGFLLGQGKAQHRPAFLAGRFSNALFAGKRFSQAKCLSWYR
jgi:predicted membrane-bound mannosyltransferase